VPSKDIKSLQKNHAKDTGFTPYARRVKGHNRNALISMPERPRVHLLLRLRWHSFATPLSFADHVYPRCFKSDADFAAPIKSERFRGDVCDVRG
jgi:hypothetical protein